MNNEDVFYIIIALGIIVISGIAAYVSLKNHKSKEKEEEVEETERRPLTEEEKSTKRSTIICGLFGILR